MSPRRALLMASGANRGAYYAGFLQPLQEAGIDFDILAGVSAGGIASAWFAAGDAPALISSWKEASRWKISFHPWLSHGMSRTVDELIQKITLQIMDVEAARKARQEVRVAVARVCGRRWPFPRLEREIFTNRQALDAEEFGRMLRATAFVPWVNGLRASVRIRGERYLDGGLVGRVPLEMIRPGEVDEIWVSACSPNGRKELQKEIEAASSRKERIIICNPSEELPVGRWTMDWERISSAIEIGRRDMEGCIRKYREK